MGYYQAGDYYQRGEVGAIVRRAAPWVGKAAGALATAGTIYEAYKGVTGSPAAAGAAAAAGTIGSRYGKVTPAPEGFPTGRIYRRMNACNPRALRRSLRRIKAFEKFARKVIHITRPGRHATVKWRFKRRRK